MLFRSGADRTAVVFTAVALNGTSEDHAASTYVITTELPDCSGTYSVTRVPSTRHATRFPFTSTFTDGGNGVRVSVNLTWPFVEMNVSVAIGRLDVADSATYFEVR